MVPSPYSDTSMLASGRQRHRTWCSSPFGSMRTNTACFPSSEGLRSRNSPRIRFICSLLYSCNRGKQSASHLHYSDPLDERLRYQEAYQIAGRLRLVRYFRFRRSRHCIARYLSPLQQARPFRWSKGSWSRDPIVNLNVPDRKDNLPSGSNRLSPQ